MAVKSKSNYIKLEPMRIAILKIELSTSDAIRQFSNLGFLNVDLMILVNFHFSTSVKFMFEMHLEQFGDLNL